MKRTFLTGLACTLLLSLLCAGCATNGRYVLLKEYAATGPSAATKPLQGVTVCIKPFQCGANLVTPSPTTKAEEPELFKYVALTSDQDRTWDKEFRALKKATAQSNCREIGNLRNMLGMTMSHVYALNDPGLWLADTLKLDLQSLGATVVDPAQAESADIGIGGTVQFCRVDIYMKIWADLVVDLELRPKGREVSHALLHTSGGTVAWVGSTAEFYQPLRECRQKFSWLTINEINQALAKTPIARVQQK